MKFRVKYEKSNIFLMSSIILCLLVTCMFWLILREYIYFAVYFALTLFISYTYFFTSYFIKEKYFVVRLGLINIKIKYSGIKSIEDGKDKLKINLKRFSFTVYPSNKEIFVAKLNSKLTNKNSNNIISK